MIYNNSMCANQKPTAGFGTGKAHARLKSACAWTVPRGVLGSRADQNPTASFGTGKAHAGLKMGGKSYMGRDVMFA